MTAPVSVIVPAYRTAPYIAEALDSVLNQTVPAAEIVVINDGSPDSAELETALVPYRSRIRYIVQENMGPGGARNTGIRTANSPFIAILDSDDVWDPRYLERNMAVFAESPEIDIVYPNVRYFGGTERRLYMDIFPSEGAVTWNSVLSRRCNVVAFVTARRDTLVKAGLYDPHLAVGEDLALWLRVLHMGGRIAYHRDPLVNYRIRSSSQTGVSTARNHEQLIMVFSRLDRELDLSPAERSSLRERIRLEEALLSLARSHEELASGNYQSARALLADANSVLMRPKLNLVLLALRFAPGLLRRTLASRG